MTPVANASDLAARYARDGYVILEHLFSSVETSQWKEEIGRALPRDGAQKHHGVYVGVSVISPLIRAANADPRIASVLNAIIGPDVEFLSDKLVYKSNDMGFGTPWHQDWQYWHGSHKVSVWIALDDARPDNGCLKLLPGSHLREVKHTGDAGDGKGFVNRLDPRDVDESKAVTAVAPAGTALVFHDQTLHASHPNTSGRDRWALISTFRNAAEPDYDYSWAKAAFMVSGRRSGPSLGPKD